jgi:hypothetical protein
MITTSHILFNTTLLGRKKNPGSHWPLILGSLLPDIPMIFYFLYMLVTHGHWRGAQMATINEYTIRQTWVDWAHSIPLAAVGLLLCCLFKKKFGLYFFTAMILHDLVDLPTHAEYAHRHFLPLSDFRFASPISYADPRYYGAWIAPLEWGLVLLCIGILWRRGIPSWLQVGLLFLGVFQGLWLIYFYGDIHW